MSEIFDQDTCDTCAASSYCSQLRLALTVLGESLASAPERPKFEQYHRILKELAEAGWDYPHSQTLCKLSGQESHVKALTDELIRLAQKQRPSGLEHHPTPDHTPGPSLYEEETSYE